MNIISVPTPDFEASYQAALAARKSAQVDLAKAQAAEQRGIDELKAAKAALSKFDELAHAIARHRADAVKAGKPVSAALPPSLLDDQKRKRNAAEYVEEVEAAQTLLHGEVETAKTRLQEAQQAVVNSAKHIMAEDFEKKATRLMELEAEFIPLWREVWAFLNIYVIATPGDMRPHAMPSKNMHNVQRMAEKYHPCIPDEVPQVREQRHAALTARLQSLIKGEQPEKPGDRLQALIKGAQPEKPGNRLQALINGEIAACEGVQSPLKIG